MEPPSLPSVKSGVSSPQSWAGDLLVLTAYEEDVKTEGETSSLQGAALLALDSDFGGALAEVMAQGGFEAKQGSASKAVRVGGAPSCLAKYVALVGLGKRDKAGVTSEWGHTAFQALGGSVASLAKTHKSRQVAVALSDAPAQAALALQQIATGALLGAYESTRFKSKAPATVSRLESLEVLLPPGASALSAEDEAAAVSRAEGITRGTFITKYLVEAPPNVCTPSFMAQAAQHVVDQAPDVMKLEVLDVEQCRAMGMGLYLGVAEASDEPLKFIHLTYTAPGNAADNRKVAIVGKGLTFDSGGYNIKAGPGSMIELMKFDMGGAAAALGAARILGQTRPPGVEVHICIASCENMVAGRGLRPGDVLTASNGKTVEVNNTDAEGRLTLADALWFAQEKCGAVSIVDVATLTGAIMIALGTEIAGLFTPSDDVAAAVVAASKRAGEKLWRMPMEPGYWETMKSAVADMRNSGDRMGSSISAAWFLKQYIKDGVDWAHIDLAGPVWDMKANLPTGYGATTLAEWATGQGSKSTAAATPANS